MDDGLRRLASRVVWWEPPEAAIARLDDFLCRVMVLGTWDDVQELDRRYGRRRLADAIEHASPGVFDARSWHYWHRRLHLGPPGPLPTRTFQ